MTEAFQDYDPHQWQGTILLLETVLRDFAGHKESSPVQRAGHALTVLATMVRSGAVSSLAAIQEFQRGRPDALFELVARPVAEFGAPDGYSCLDVRTDEPRNYGLEVVFSPQELPADDPRAGYLADPGLNVAFLEVVGVWQASVPSPLR